MMVCEKCGASFPTAIWIDGKRRILNKRRYCLICSPWGQHNTKVLSDEGKTRAIPDPLPPSENLAYLIGIISGDGCLYQFATTVELIITCDDRYPELIIKYEALLRMMITGNVRIQHSNQGNYTVIRLINPDLPVLLNLPTGSKAKNEFQVPEWIFQTVEFVKPFLRGLIETDGGIYVINRGEATGWHCHFTAFNENIMRAFLRGVELLGYEFKRYKKTARLSTTPKVKSLIQTLEITKFREYTY
ncbi:MAG: hypothetical protein KF726_09365 [Anaerolineae bacterium]|nr:hypothetical protein [Anaerolineae bacterium]